MNTSSGSLDPPPYSETIQEIDRYYGYQFNGKLLTYREKIFHTIPKAVE